MQVQNSTGPIVWDVQICVGQAKYLQQWLVNISDKRMEWFFFFSFGRWTCGFIWNIQAWYQQQSISRPCSHRNSSMRVECQDLSSTLTSDHLCQHCLVEGIFWLLIAAFPANFPTPVAKALDMVHHESVQDPLCGHSGTLSPDHGETCLLTEKKRKFVRDVTKQMLYIKAWHIPLPNSWEHVKLQVGQVASGKVFFESCILWLYDEMVKNLSTFCLISPSYFAYLKQKVEI